MSREIEISCLPAQREMLLSDNRIVCMVAGLGAGKSRSLCYKSLQLGFENGDVPGLIISPTFDLIKKVIYITFEEVCDELGLKCAVNKADAVIRIEDRFSIFCKSGEEPSRIVGINAAWGGIDEPGIQDEEVYKKLLARVRNPRAKKQQIILTGTPEGINWYAELCRSGRAHVIRARTRDNPYLTEEYIEELTAHLSEVEKLAYLEGEFISMNSGWYRTIPRSFPPMQKLDEDIDIFRLPQQGSGQYVIGVDTGGGLLKDSSAIVVLDKRDAALMATWVSNKAPIDELVEKTAKLFHHYSSTNEHKYAELLGKHLNSTNAPTVIIEQNGIGHGTWQGVTIKKKIPAISHKTTEATRYEGMLLARRAVEAGKIEGPEQLRIEAESLWVENNRFKGPKDLSMALGFCLRYIEQNPFKQPDIHHRDVFRLDLKKPQRQGRRY